VTVEDVGVHDLIAVGLTRRQVDHWTKRGYLRALEREQPGSGFPRRYHPDEVFVARAALRLCTAGLHVGKAAEIARGHLDSGSLSFRLDPAVVLVISPDLWAPDPDPAAMPSIPLA
jgi:hypothetical protein